MSDRRLADVGIAQTLKGTNMGPVGGPGGHGDIEWAPLGGPEEVAGGVGPNERSEKEAAEGSDHPHHPGASVGSGGARGPERGPGRGGRVVATVTIGPTPGSGRLPIWIDRPPGGRAP